MMTRAAGLLVLLASARAGIPLGPPKGLLSFEICGGLTNLWNLAFFAAATASVGGGSSGSMR